MSLNNPGDVVNWLKDNPNKPLYDKYGNFLEYDPNSNIIRHEWYTGDWMDGDGNFEPGMWDCDKYNVDEFVKEFNFNDFLNYELED